MAFPGDTEYNSYTGMAVRSFDPAGSTATQSVKGEHPMRITAALVVLALFGLTPAGAAT